MPIEPFGPEDRAVPFFEQEQVTGLSMSTVKRLLKDPVSDFPRPFNLTKQRKAIMLSALQAFNERRAKAAKAGPSASPESLPWRAPANTSAATSRPRRRRAETEAA